MLSADRILLAVSGGADSTALLHIFCALRNKGVVKADLLCAHINHCLRGAESDGDQRFVAGLCSNLGVPVIVRQVDVRGFARCSKLSIETAARNLRLQALLDIARENNCNCIATAHQKDDNAETIIQRLIRGTGFRGLAGIWPSRPFSNVAVIRPLLCATRAEIEQYLRGRGVTWCIDRTNEDVIYRRNFIRHRLIPEIQQQCAVPVSGLLFGLAQSARGLAGLIDKATDEIWQAVADVTNEQATLQLDKLAAQPHLVKIELIRRALTTLGCGEADLSEKHYEAILRLANRQGGGIVNLPDGFTACTDSSKLFFAQRRCEAAAGGRRSNLVNIDPVQLAIPGTTEFADYTIEAGLIDAEKIDLAKFKKEKTAFVEWFDLDKIEQPVVVRFRKAGDRFRPLGQPADKKVGKFLTDAKIPPHLRRNIVVVHDCEKIIWLWPVRISERAKVQLAARRILELKIVESTAAQAQSGE